jgi:hypothetical protein
MIPMAITTEQNAPLGRAVIGGLLWATCTTLLFVPVVFKMVHSRAKKPADLTLSKPPADLKNVPEATIILHA